MTLAEFEREIIAVAMTSSICNIPSVRPPQLSKPALREIFALGHP
jgi:hypothetical protein